MGRVTTNGKAYRFDQTIGKSMAKQISIGNQNVYRSDWGDPVGVKRWLRDHMFKGEVLNFPCGGSEIGDVRADLDREHDPDLVADLHNLPFQEQSFDTVYCDPPYHFYGGEQYYFINPLWDLCRERLIFQTNKVTIRVKGADKSIYTLETKGHNPTLLIFQVFDRPDTKLTDYE